MASPRASYLTDKFDGAIATKATHRRTHETTMPKHHEKTVVQVGFVCKDHIDHLTKNQSSRPHMKGHAFCRAIRKVFIKAQIPALFRPRTFIPCGKIKQRKAKYRKNMQLCSSTSTRVKNPRMEMQLYPVMQSIIETSEGVVQKSSSLEKSRRAIVCRANECDNRA